MLRRDFYIVAVGAFVTFLGTSVVCTVMFREGMSGAARSVAYGLQAFPTSSQGEWQLVREDDRSFTVFNVRSRRLCTVRKSGSDEMACS